jgi:solute carrier family 35 (adenosine 3'-phospho 5'-phosphosulfate transporter), member B2
MLMGRIVSKRKYEFYEYTVAILISFGMVCFFFGKENSRESSNVTTFSGILIMVGYMAFDSFTSIWQGELFKVSLIQSLTGLILLFLAYFPEAGVLYL